MIERTQKRDGLPEDLAKKLAELHRPTVKILGLGGGGSNAVNRMIELGLEGVHFVAANTDRQALASSLAPTKIQLGPRITRGLGAGGDPKVGASAALESARELAACLRGADMVFITAGMGGGTGTGSAPVAAEIARELGAVVVSIVTMPFGFEMTRRQQNAIEGLTRLQPFSHTLINVPNDRLLEIAPPDLSLEVAFRLADDVLRQGVQGVSELITRPGMVNVDFANVRELLSHGGGALMSIGIGEGPEKAVRAVNQAFNHPLVHADGIQNTRGALVQFTGGDDLTLVEIGEAMTALQANLSDEVDVVMGASTEPAMEGRVQVILILTGANRIPSAAPVSNFATEKPTDIEPPTTPEAPSVDEDLDLPTFLRKRLTVGG